MSRKHKFLDQQQAYFVSFATVHWIDVFTRKVYCDEIVESLKYCQQEKGLVLYAWCIMPSHVHLIMGTKGEKMQDILRDLKSYTSRRIKEQIANYPKESRREWMQWMFRKAGSANSNNQTYQFWRQDNRPMEVTSNEFFHQKMEYIHYNPVKEGFCDTPEAYPYSSALWYKEKQGMIEIDEVLI